MKRIIMDDPDWCTNCKLIKEYNELVDNWETIKNIIKNMVLNGYEKDDYFYFATNYDSEFGTRAKVLLEIMEELEKGE